MVVSNLADLCLKAFCLSLEDARVIEHLNLPHSFKLKMRGEVKKLWVTQNALVDVKGFNYSSIDLLNMDRLKLNMLMNHPFEVPEFVFEVNHVVWDFYLWKGGDITFNICVICAKRLFQFDNHRVEYYWGVQNFKIFHCKNHKQIDGGDMLTKVIWDHNNYCDICVIQSLYIIYSEEECREDSTFHYPTPNDSDSSCEEYDHSSQSLI